MLHLRCLTVFRIHPGEPTSHVLIKQGENISTAQRKNRSKRTAYEGSCWVSLATNCRMLRWKLEWLKLEEIWWIAIYFCKCFSKTLLSNMKINLTVLQAIKCSNTIKKREQDPWSLHWCLYCWLWTIAHSEPQRQNMFQAKNQYRMSPS